MTKNEAVKIIREYADKVDSDNKFNSEINAVVLLTMSISGHTARTAYGELGTITYIIDSFKKKLLSGDL